MPFMCAADALVQRSDGGPPPRPPKVVFVLWVVFTGTLEDRTLKQELAFLELLVHSAARKCNLTSKAFINIKVCVCSKLNYKVIYFSRILIKSHLVLISPFIDTLLSNCSVWSTGRTATLFLSETSKMCFMSQQEIVLVEGSRVFESWKTPPPPVYMEFFFFNVTNVDQILAKGKPEVTQVGPYTYR